MNTTMKLAIAAAIAVGATTASASAAPPELSAAQRNEIRTVAKQYRDVEAALAAGYVPVSDCVEAPGIGGMGVHYMNPALVDTVVEPTEPEMLVYYPDQQGHLRLGAVEYFVPDADGSVATDGDRPSLYGEHAFDGPHEPHGPGQPVHYDLHVWVMKQNPAGELAGLNPLVSCETAS